MARNKKKSEFLSVFGVAFEVWKSIMDATLAAGGTDDDIRDLKENPDKLAEIARIIVGALPSHHFYRLDVSYAKLPGVAALEPKFSGENSVSDLFDGRTWLLRIPKPASRRVFGLSVLTPQ